jgi:hypothetical protein
MMIDITSQKVSIPAALFIALSPGVVLTTTGKNVKFQSGNTSRQAVFFHALVFLLAYSLIARALGLVLTKTDLLVTVALFVALSPGILLTLPKNSAGSLQAAVVHAVVFAVVFALLRKQFPQFY